MTAALLHLLPWAGLALSGTTGWFVVATLWPRCQPIVPAFLFRVCLGMGLGLTISSGVHLLWLMLPGQSIATMWLGDTAAAGLAAWLWWRRNRPHANFRRPQLQDAPEVYWMRWICWSLTSAAIAAIVLCVLALAVQSMRHPHGQWDAWTMWNFKARCFFRGPDRWTEVLALRDRSSHSDYPLFLPLTVARLWQYLGRAWVVVPATIAALFTLLTVAALYGVVAVRRGPAQASLAALGLVSNPLFVMHGASQYADTILGLFVLVALGLIVLAASQHQCQLGLWTLAGMATGAAAWTKNEGLLFAVAVVIGLLVAMWLGRSGQIRWPALGAVLMGCLPLGALSVVLKVTLAGRNDLLSSMSWQRLWQCLLDLDRHFLICQSLWYGLITGRGYELLWLLPMYALVAGVARPGIDRQVLGIVALVLVLMAGGYYALYVLTPHPLVWHLATSRSRLVMHLWPAAMLVAFDLLGSPGAAMSRWMGTTPLTARHEC